MKKTWLIILIVLLSSIIATTPFSKARAELTYSGLVNCDGVVKTAANSQATEPGRTNVCNWNALVQMVNKVINWMFIISIPVASVLFAYAGLLYMKGAAADRTKANKIFTTVGIGFIIMLVAWLSVRTIVNWFVRSDSGATTFLGN